MTVVRIPSWGFEISRADYYGWRYCLHVGVWLVFLMRVQP